MAHKNKRLLVLQPISERIIILNHQPTVMVKVTGSGCYGCSSPKNYWSTQAQLNTLQKMLDKDNDVK